MHAENAVDPQNFEPNLALDLEIADLINSKKGNAYGLFNRLYSCNSLDATVLEKPQSLSSIISTIETPMYHY